MCGMNAAAAAAAAAAGRGFTVNELAPQRTGQPPSCP